MFKKFIVFMLLINVFLISQASILKAEAKYQIKEMTPAVKQALEQRKERFDQLEELKSTGAIGENNRGYIEALLDDQSAKDMVVAENVDRLVIYETIAEQNDIKEALADIEKTFARIKHAKALPGEKIQDQEGNWKTK